jgi:hypothetical protein
MATKGVVYCDPRRGLRRFTDIERTQVADQGSDHPAQGQRITQTKTRQATTQVIVATARHASSHCAMGQRFLAAIVGCKILHDPLISFHCAIYKALYAANAVLAVEALRFCLEEVAVSRHLEDGQKLECAHWGCAT